MNIGKTRTNNPVIYDPSQDLDAFEAEILGLSLEDQFDFYCIYQWLLIRSSRKYGEDSEDLHFWINRARILTSAIPEEDKETQMNLLGLKTSFHLVKFGREMTDDFWREY